MGCGHSKINIYPRKSKGKNSSKKSEEPDLDALIQRLTRYPVRKYRATGGSGSSNSSNGGGTVRGCGGTNGYTTSNGGGCEDGGQQNGGSGSDDETQTQRTIDGSGGNNNTSEELQPLQQDDVDGGDSGGTKVKLKPHTAGGPLLAHSEISESQQNFFRMLDEKIENGPDYDSSSEIEQMKENERLTSLLQDWETASAASRSLPSTPRHYPHQQQNTQLPQQQHYPQQPHPQHSQQHILQHQSSITSLGKHHPPTHHQQTGPIPQTHQNYIANTASIPKQQIIHQPAMNMLHHHHPAYGGPPPSGSTTVHNPPFQTYSPPTHHHTGNPSMVPQQPHTAPPLTVFSKVVPGMQYTESLSLNSQIKQNLTNFVAQRQLQIAAAQQAHVVQHYHHPMSMVAAPRDVPSMVQNYSTAYSNTQSQSSSSQSIISSPIHKHSRIPSANIQSTQQTPPHLVRQNSGNVVYNAALPQHSSISMYTSPASSVASQHSPSAQSSINPDYTNGELILQQQLYNQQLKSHLSKEIQQYKQSREQLLIKQQQQQQEQQILVQTQHAIVAQHNKPTRIMPANPQQQQQSYQSSVEMNINRTATTGTDPMSPKMMYRKQNTSSSTTTTRQYSQEMT